MWASGLISPASGASAGAAAAAMLTAGDSVGLETRPTPSTRADRYLPYQPCVSLLNIRLPELNSNSSHSRPSAPRDRSSLPAPYSGCAPKRSRNRALLWSERRAAGFFKRSPTRKIRPRLNRYHHARLQHLLLFRCDPRSFMQISSPTPWPAECENCFNPAYTERAASSTSPQRTPGETASIAARCASSTE